MQQFKTSLQYNHRQDKQKPSQVPHYMSCHIVLIPLGAFYFLFFLPSLFLLLFSPWPGSFPAHAARMPRGVAGRQLPLLHTPVPWDLPLQYSTSYASRLLEIVCPCILPPCIPGLSLLPHLTHPSCHHTLSSGVFFHAQLPQGHLLSCIFFLKMSYPKPCKP